ncbi:MULTISPECIES: helix-turn-helix domain-containing protein [Achromobacter]|uniref:helix-turn-helix domain-containing protein n=1 Tax=Achromobacter TaxID=222 RepID=UPI0023F89818|nr:helix-turn-helix domain-containing protein [Achromobacter anxifer]MDF8365091.1 helix-turn-helix domain-containing protein [Achromobacter anxifer]
MATKDNIEDATYAVQHALATRLSSTRKARGLSQIELAKRAGVSRAALVRAEDPDQDVTVATLVRLALGLGLTTRLLEKAPLGEEAEQYVVPAADIVHRGERFERTLRELHWRDRQREAALANDWEEANKHRPTGIAPHMAGLVENHTQAQASAVATVVQWLGSEVGFAFLNEALKKAGYEVVDTRENSVRRRKN